MTKCRTEFLLFKVEWGRSTITSLWSVIALNVQSVEWASGVKASVLKRASCLEGAFPV